MFKKIVLSLFLAISVQVYAANIVFDLGDVVIETKYGQTLWNIGPLKMLHYASTGNNPFAAHKKLFSFLDSIKPYDTDQIIIKDAHGHRMPQLFIDWLKGTVSGQEILQLIHTTPGNFANNAEEALVRALAEVLFIPDYFVQTRHIIPQAVALIKDCKRAGHWVYVLSNWEPESFDLLKQLYPELFDLFVGIVISGKVGMAKPENEIYQYLLETYHLDPDETILIDDQHENIVAARKNGIYGIHYTKKRGLFGCYHDFSSVRTHIDSHLISKDLLVPVNDNR
jgi:FMN phosphatase YigB (HAD superfamily)